MQRLNYPLTGLQFIPDSCLSEPTRFHQARSRARAFLSNKVAVDSRIQLNIVFSSSVRVSCCSPEGVCLFFQRKARMSAISGSLSKRSHCMCFCGQSPIDASSCGARTRDLTKPPEARQARLTRRCLARQIGAWPDIAKHAFN